MVILNFKQMLEQYKQKFMTKLPVVGYQSDYIQEDEEVDQEEITGKLVNLFATSTKDRDDLIKLRAMK